jgi:hypothetical protein
VRWGPIVGAVVVMAGTASAEERPPTSHLIAAGAAMAIPTYAIGVIAHEGSHALAARLSGARLESMYLLPGWRRGKFYFGYVEVAGLRCDRQRAAFLLAPKLTDAVMLGGYAAAYFGGVYPHDRYGQLALTVLATGFWIDFSKDVLAFWDHSDVVKAYRLAGAETELGRLPFRLVHAGLATAAAIAVVRGWRDVFARPDPDGGTAARVFTLPLWSTGF